MKLHGFFRSTASYRVRIALNWKGLSYENASYVLRQGAQREASYLAINPQGLVPTLDTAGAHLTQSLAICEYLEEEYPEPALLPANSLARARIRAFAQVIACDIHPVQNLKILSRLSNGGYDAPAVAAWARTTIAEGLAACAALMNNYHKTFCFGDNLTLADVCLVPQLMNARRFEVPLDGSPLLKIEAACLELPAFKLAAPEAQPDYEA